MHPVPASLSQAVLATPGRGDDLADPVKIRAGTPDPGSPYLQNGKAAVARCCQGWTGPLGPRSRRSDCMMANVVVVMNTSMAAAASTRCISR
jgi:hypothetical protein